MPSLSPTLLRPLLFTAAIGLPLITYAADRNPGVQAGISAGATSGAYAHYDVKPLVVPSIAWQGERFFPKSAQPARRRVRPREVLKIGDVFRVLRPFVCQERSLLRKRTRKPSASVPAAERAAAGPLAAVAVRARKTAVEGEFRDPPAELFFQIGTYGVVVDAAEDIFQIEGSV